MVMIFFCTVNLSVLESTLPMRISFLIYFCILINLRHVFFQVDETGLEVSINLPS